jgi:hypothetical protein
MRSTSKAPRRRSSSTPGGNPRALRLHGSRTAAGRVLHEPRDRAGSRARRLRAVARQNAAAVVHALRAPPKNSVGPDALGVPGPCFAARETSENLQMISQRRKRLAFAPAASDVRFSDCVKRPSALALERRLRCDPSHAGVMPYGPAESWLPRLSATPYPPARRLRRLDSLALCCDDVKTFSPEHGLCQIKFFRWSQRPMRQNEARPARTTRSGSSSCARGKPK